LKKNCQKRILVRKELSTRRNKMIEHNDRNDGERCAKGSLAGASTAATAAMVQTNRQSNQIENKDNNFGIIWAWISLAN